MRGELPCAGRTPEEIADMGSRIAGNGIMYNTYDGKLIINSNVPFIDIEDNAAKMKVNKAASDFFKCIISNRAELDDFATDGEYSAPHEEETELFYQPELRSAHSRNLLRQHH